MRLIVGSVFTSCNKTPDWLRLQLRFLDKTTDNFEHAVFINGNIDHSVFQQSTIIGSSLEEKSDSPDGKAQSRNHSIGLNAILSYFRDTPADAYLLLDSDCFPVYPNWLNVLIKKMRSTRDYKPQIAAAVRFENLDAFPHPCAMFIPAEAIQEPWIKLDLGKGKTLLQTEIEDNGCSIPMNKVYPLLKSNMFCYHPMFATVYNHMFYHHACGSRDMMPRSVMRGYFDHYIPEDQHVMIKNRLFRRLLADPDGYIDKLMNTATKSFL